MGCRPSTSHSDPIKHIYRGSKVGGIDLNSHPTLAFTPSKASTLDLCLLLDCSQLMEEYLVMIKSHLSTIVSKLKASNKDLCIRIAIIGYRDIQDSLRFEMFSFSENVEQAEKFLAKLKAFGKTRQGPNDVNGGFQKALYEIEWKALTKVIYHIGVAPAHGYMFHDLSEAFPYGYKKDRPWKEMFERFRQLKISYVFFDVEGKNEKMFEKFCELYEDGASSLDKENMKRVVLQNQNVEIKNYETFVKTAVLQAQAYQTKMTSYVQINA